MNYNIAIVEDNELILNMVKLNLERNKYRVSCFTRGEDLLEKVEYEIFDLVILDLLLPGITGMEVVESLRQKNVELPVLMLTVQDDVHSKVRALNSGADDYLVKPFNMDELLARVNALIRRSRGKRKVSANILVIDDHKIDLSTRECDSNHGRVVLSEKEVKLLSYFAQHEGEVLSRADILEEVWGMDVSPTPRTVDNFILKFRKLFEQNPEKPEHFLSIRNKGYRLTLKE